MVRFLFVLSVALLTGGAAYTGQSLLFGGGWSGNGGNGDYESDNIWFLGTGPVSWCLERSEDYPFSARELRYMVRDAISDWKRFFRRYDIHTRAFGDDDRGRFFDSVPRLINRNFIETNCADFLPLQPDLKFMFGTSNRVVDEYRRFNKSHYPGISLRRSFNHRLLRNPGYISIARFSDERARVKHMILHELGHVFGMRHNSVFVMADNAGRMAMDPDIYSFGYLGRIETGSWRYRLREGESVVMTENEGLRVLPAILGVILGKCKDEDFLPGRFLPDFVREAFQISPLQCFKITLRLDGINADQSRSFTLELETTGDDLKRSYQGSIAPRSQGPFVHPGPGVYTQWHQIGKSDGDSRWKRLIAGAALQDFPSGGALFKDGEKMAVRFQQYKGPTLDIFIAASGRWWTLSSVHGLFEDDPGPELRTPPETQ